MSSIIRVRREYPAVNAPFANRIEAGIELLAEPDVLESFTIANRAMGRAARQRFATQQGKKPEEVDSPAWRPFQLAFLLMTLKGIADPQQDERQLVDLLFFPTGGGKTEAYLGLATFTLVLRRLRNPGIRSAGMSVLMRYTLRLLTLDQLARAAATPEENLDHAIRQLVSKAVSPDGEVVDVFSAAGMKRPDISILSDEFLTEIRDLEHKNVAAELLEKLLKDEIKTRARRNVVQSRTFSEMLKNSVNKYHNRAIATHKIIDELINLAREMREASKRGEDLELNDDEICFYPTFPR